ncbi:MAG: radical SAM protein [Candidatus Aenigmatarchaeota archaeon]
MNELHDHPRYYDICYNRPQKMKAECSFITDILKSFNSKSVLDLCCGPAYHAIHLANNGLDAWGLDVSDKMIDYARTKSSKVRFVKADMTDFAIPVKFDACINTFNSFGYLHTKKDALANLRSVRACLKDGGIYLIFLKHMNDYIKEPRKSSWKAAGQNVKITVSESEQRIPDKRLVRFDESYTINEDGQIKTISNSDVKRAWTAEEIRVLADMSGFKVLGEYGDYDKSVGLDDENAKEMIMLLSAARTQSFYEFFNSEQALGIWGPKTVEVEITNKCNMRCKMCDRWQWIKSNPKLSKEMSLEQLKKLFSEMKSIGTEKILLSGGEPLMRPDFKEIIKSIRSHGMKVTIVTNGTLMDDGIASTLAGAGAETIFSIDGSDAGIHDLSRGVKGTWVKAMDGISMIVSANAKVRRGSVGINYTVQPLNAHDAYDVVELADKLKVDFIRLGMMHGRSAKISQNDVNELRSAVEKIRSAKFHTKVIASPYLIGLVNGTLDIKYFKKGLPAYELFKNDPVTCMLCYQCSLIDASGDVYPCSYSYFDNQPFDKSYNAKRKQSRVGNVLTESFDRIWSGSRYSDFRRQHNPVDISKSKSCCGQCEHYFGFKTIRGLLQGELTQHEMLRSIKDGRACTWSNEFEMELNSKKD